MFTWRTDLSNCFGIGKSNDKDDRDDDLDTEGVSTQATIF